MDAAVKLDFNDKLHTVRDIEALPEGRRAELVDGVIYDMAAPSLTHQRLVLGISRRISSHIEAAGGSCETFIAPCAVYPEDDDYNYLEPDVFVVCDKTKLDEKGCHGAPDVVFEVVSPSSQMNDYILKLSKYAISGVKEYWIVDPDSLQTNIYDFIEYKDNKSLDLRRFSFDEEAESTVFPGFSIKMSDEMAGS